MKFSAKAWTFLLLGSPVFAEVKTSGELGSEAAYRFSKESNQQDTARVDASAQLKLTPESLPIAAEGAFLGWRNYAANNFGMQESALEVRRGNIQTWGDTWGMTVGYQEIRWGETFGYQALDLVHARNFGDYALLDSGRNRIPILAASAYKMFDRIKFTGIFNPFTEIPILPEKVDDQSLENANRSRQWMVGPEFGGKASLAMNASNVDLYFYRHQSRIPALTPKLIGGTPGFLAHYEQVSSVGLGFSGASDEFVLRSDALFTWAEPVGSMDSEEVSKQNTYSFTVGADYNPAALMGGVIGLQFHLDHFPVPKNPDQRGISVMMRKTFLEDQMSAEAYYFGGILYDDKWAQVKLTSFFSHNIALCLIGDWTDMNPDSPIVRFYDYDRISTGLSWSF